MKRDMDLARSILIALEEAPYDGFPILRFTIPDHSDNEVSYHVMLLHEAGLLRAFDVSADDSGMWLPAYLTWDGHEFLEAAKDDTRWNQAKTYLKDNGAPMIFDVLKTLLVSYAKRKMFGPTSA